MEVVFRDVQLSLREYVRLNLRLTGKMLWQRLRIWVLLLGGVLLIRLVLMPNDVGNGSAPVSHASSPLDYLPYAFPIVFFVVLPLVALRTFRRNYQTARLLHKPATYCFTEAGLRVESPYQQSQIAWLNFTAAYRQSPHAIVMTSTVTGVFLDFRCLEAPATEADFWALLARHGVAVK